MKKQSELLNELLAMARRNNISVHSTKTHVEFYSQEQILLLKYRKFKVDYTLSDIECEIYMKKLT